MSRFQPFLSHFKPNFSGKLTFLVFLIWQMFKRGKIFKRGSIVKVRMLNWGPLIFRIFLVFCRFSDNFWVISRIILDDFPLNLRLNLTFSGPIFEYLWLFLTFSGAIFGYILANLKIFWTHFWLAKTWIYTCQVKNQTWIWGCQILNQTWTRLAKSQPRPGFRPPSVKSDMIMVLNQYWNENFN